VTGIAAENNEPLIIHLSETKNENDGCRARYNGLSPTQVFMKAGADKTKLIAAHGVWLDDTDMELLRGKTVVTCPQSNLKLGSGIADVPRMLEHGINVALGTDGAASNNNLDMLLETRFLTLLSKRTDPLRMKGTTALKIARAGGTKAMGVNAGRLEEGAEADLILIDISSERYQPLLNLDSHIVYSSRSDDVTMTMVAGNILMSERKILFADEKEIKARFDECARNIYQGE
jgi:5-methylthioadenosine/S-adenosylhomocysteine deaminase